MSRQFRIRRLRMIIALALFGLSMVAGLGWIERTRLLAWYYLRGLISADNATRKTWVERVAGLDEAAVGPLLGSLRKEEANGAANVQSCLEYLVARWEPDNRRRAQLADQLVEAFPGLTIDGQRAAISLQLYMTQTAADASYVPMLQPACRLVVAAARVSSGDVHMAALGLVILLLDRTEQPEVQEACQKLICSCISDDVVANRLEAIRLASRPGMELLERLVPLLRDPVPEVRRAAMLAVGPAQAVIGTDDLLPFLHDADDDVRALCEKALRSRGLEEGHLRLGQLMTDNHPAVRLQVLDLLRRADDLEPGIWLRRLSHDVAPAVRAAAVRAASEQRLVDLSDRLEQMAQNDPCPTVRQLAQYYLSTQKSRNASPSGR